MGKEIQDVKEYKEPNKVIKFVSKHKVPLAIAATTAAAAGTAYSINKRNKKRKEEDASQNQFSEDTSKKNNALDTIQSLGAATSIYAGSQAAKHGILANTGKDLAKFSRRHEQRIIKSIKDIYNAGGSILAQDAVEIKDHLMKNRESGRKLISEAKKHRNAMNFNKKLAIGSAGVAATAYGANKIYKHVKNKKSSKNNE